jgi:outer membrane protein
MKKSIYLIAFLSLFAVSSVFADPSIKIGVVDMNQVLQKSTLMKKMNDDLAKKYKSRQDEINKATLDLQNEASQLETNGATLSAADRSKLQNKVITDKANVQILTASFQKDIAIEKDQLLQNFMSKLSGVITKIAQDGQYDMIEQQTNMLFVNPKLDITSQILQQL